MCTGHREKELHVDVAHDIATALSELIADIPTDALLADAFGGFDANELPATRSHPLASGIGHRTKSAGRAGPRRS